MPTLNEVLERTGRARPDGIEDAVKAAWLLALDGQLRAEAAEHEGELPPGDALARVWPEDGAKPLLVGEPWDALYDHWIYCQGDALNREYDHYANSAALYNAAVDEWRKQYHRAHRPVRRGGYVHVF